MTVPRQWTATAGLTWTRYDDSDDWVVFNPASADVHLLTASAQKLWTVVSDGQPHATEDVAAAIADLVGDVSSEELQRATADMLAFMDAVGLIRPACVRS
jgi:PqqD family protein of HPr-rel-A system